tara:strand:+ start:2184 stop:3887 length:1704 start_codon:yes stop_codon:yes gene_type:complete
MSNKELAHEGLVKAALSAHNQGDIKKALSLYQSCISRIKYPPCNIFANYGALLREDNQTQNAGAVYRLGLKIYPENYHLLANYANLQLQEGLSSKALALYIRAENVVRENITPKKKEFLDKQQATTLSDLGMFKLALGLLEPYLASNPDDQDLRLGMAELNLEIKQKARAVSLIQPLFDNFDPTLNQAFIFANILLKLQNFELALKIFDQATESHRRRQKELDKKTRLKYDTTCWNFALMLLRRGLLDRGWRLFEHGKRVPNGKGGYQRTVIQAFSSVQLPDWSGESLEGKRLLINGEQGIGDVMMFSMLIKPLINDAKKVGIITYDRLKSLYERSFTGCEIFDNRDVNKKKIDVNDWDIQAAMGTLPMIRYRNLEDYSKLKPFLIPNPIIKEELKSRFKTPKRPLIGFSWKGGGNAKQKRTKSLSLEDFLPLFRLPGFDWISLQYGNVSDEIIKFNSDHGLNIKLAEDVNPLQDMDRWTALVSCCDEIISAANTTIHGGGCLGVPTTVILAKDPDWRWLGDEGSNCYWYDSVSIARQKAVGDWNEPIVKILDTMNLRYGKIKKYAS